MPIDFYIAILVFIIAGIFLIARPETMWKLMKRNRFRKEKTPTERQLSYTRALGVLLIIAACISFVQEVFF